MASIALVVWMRLVIDGSRTSWVASCDRELSLRYATVIPGPCVIEGDLRVTCYSRGKLE